MEIEDITAALHAAEAALKVLPAGPWRTSTVRKVANGQSFSSEVLLDAASVPIDFTDPRLLDDLAALPEVFQEAFWALDVASDELRSIAEREDGIDDLEDRIDALETELEEERARTWSAWFELSQLTDDRDEWRDLADGCSEMAVRDPLNAKIREQAEVLQVQDGVVAQLRAEVQHLKGAYDRVSSERYADAQGFAEERAALRRAPTQDSPGPSMPELAKSLLPVLANAEESVALLGGQLRKSRPLENAIEALGLLREALAAAADPTKVPVRAKKGSRR